MDLYSLKYLKIKKHQKRELMIWFKKIYSYNIPKTSIIWSCTLDSSNLVQLIALYSQELKGREILDSRGNPTVEAALTKGDLFWGTILRTILGVVRGDVFC